MAGSSVLSDPTVRRIVIGFCAGVLAVLTFHQLAILLLKVMGFIPAFVPWAMDAFGPLGVPRIVNSAFWGGLWGIAFAFLVDRFPREGAAYLAAGFVFGILGPALASWFVVAPIKGTPVAAGWVPAALARGVFINGMFGIGIAVFHQLVSRWLGNTRAA